MASPQKKNSVRVTPKQVQDVAKLARLTIDKKDLDKFTASFEATLNWVAQLQEVDVADVPETSQVTGLSNITRPDRVRPGLGRDDFLAAAPAYEADQLKVRAIFSE